MRQMRFGRRRGADVRRRSSEVQRDRNDVQIRKIGAIVCFPKARPRTVQDGHEHLVTGARGRTQRDLRTLPTGPLHVHVMSRMGLP